MARSMQHNTRPDEGPAAPPGRFDLLLIVMVCAYLLSALTNGRWIDALRVVLFTVVALLALRGSLLPRRAARLILVAVLAGSAIMVALSFTTEIGRGIASIWAGLVLLLAVVVIVRRVLSVGTVTAQNIYGAVSAYLMIGVAFAAFFAAIDHLRGGHFFAKGHPASTQTFQYFSFTTLTTLGYRDFTAAGNFGRALADLEALTGQIFLVLLPGPCLLTGVSVEAPGSSVTSRVRSPGNFPPVLVVLRAQSRLRLEGRTRTLSGPSPDLTPARTPALSASPASACQVMGWQRQHAQAGGVFGCWPPRPAVTRAAKPK